MGEVSSDTAKIGATVSRRQILQWIPEVAGKEVLRNRLANVLFGDVKLPSALFSDSKLLEVVNNPESNLSDLIEQIKLYPDLSVRIVQISRSAIFGGTQVEGFQDACARIGMRAIRELVYSAQMAQGFSRFTVPIDWQVFWTRSILIARLNERIVTSYLGPRNMGFLAGLVHDIGTLMLNEFFQSEMAEVHQWVAQGMSLPTAENIRLGFTHAHVSGVLCLKWKFPLQCAMGTYHRYSDFASLADDKTAIYAACGLVSSRLADSVLSTEGTGYFQDQDLVASPEWSFLQNFQAQSSLNIDLAKELEVATELASQILFAK